MDSSADRCIRHMKLGQCVTCAPACRLNKYSILQSTTSAQCGWSTEGSCCTNSVVSLLTYKKAVTLQHFRSPARLRLANRLVEKNEVSVKLWLLTSSHDDLCTSIANIAILCFSLSSAYLKKITRSSVAIEINTLLQANQATTTALLCSRLVVDPHPNFITNSTLTLVKWLTLAATLCCFC